MRKSGTPMEIPPRTQNYNTIIELFEDGPPKDQLQHSSKTLHYITYRVGWMARVGPVMLGWDSQLTRWVDSTSQSPSSLCTQEAFNPKIPGRGGGVNVATPIRDKGKKHSDLHPYFFLQKNLKFGRLCPLPTPSKVKGTMYSGSFLLYSSTFFHQYNPVPHV